MAQDRVQFAQIGSYQPAIDYRKTGVIGVLDGRNFAWDAAGVMAAFGSRLIAADTSLGVDGGVAYEIEAPDRFHVAIHNKVSKLVPSGTGLSFGAWEDVVTLDQVQTVDESQVPEYYRGFTSDFLANRHYTCSWNHGVYHIADDDTYTRLTSGTVTGFPTDAEPLIAIAETNGRMLYLSETTLYFSGPNDPEDLTPTLGGAGFQVIGERVSGQPRALTPIATGAIIWTTGGALVAEFVASDISFRFYELASDVLPLSQSATVKLPTNAYLVLTRLGLYSVVHAQSPEVVTPLFNEFIREYLRERKLEVAHMWYTQADNRLFMSLKTTDGRFFETFCLDIGLDRWGIFSEPHLGMFHYLDARSPFAYMAPSGIASYMLPGRDPNKNRENPYNPGTFQGLGSSVTIGFIRSEGLVSHGDSVQELQEVTVYRQNPIEGYGTTYVDEGNPGAASPVTVDEGLTTDPVLLTFDEGLLTQERAPSRYKLTVITDLFSPEESLLGDFNSSPMYLAQAGAFADVWTARLPSFHFKLKFDASIDGEYFRINAVDCTLASAGQLI